MVEETLYPGSAHRSIGVLGQPWFGTQRSFPAKGFQLVTLLASSSSLREPRRRVAQVLWSGSGDEEALANLRQLLVRVRRCGADRPPLAADTSTVSLGVGCADLDLLEFRRVCGSRDAGDLTTALSLYRGDLHEGADDGTSEAMQEWLEVERSALRSRFLEGGAVIQHTTCGWAESP